MELGVSWIQNSYGRHSAPVKTINNTRNVKLPFIKADIRLRFSLIESTMEFAGLKRQCSKSKICPKVNPLSGCHYTNMVLHIWWRSLLQVVHNSIANLDINTDTFAQVFD